MNHFSKNIESVIDVLSTVSLLNKDFGDCIVIFSNEGKILWLNQRAEDLSKGRGKGKKDLATHLFTELDLARVFATQNTAPVSLCKVGIHESTMLASATLLTESTLIVFLRDISDTRAMAGDISKYLQKNTIYKLALHAMGGCLVVSDAFDNVIFANDAAKQLFAKVVETWDGLRLSALRNHITVLEEIPPLGSRPGAASDEPVLVKIPLSHASKINGYLLCPPPAIELPANGAVCLVPGKDSHREIPPPETTGRDRKDGGAKSDILSYSLRDFVGQSESVLRIKKVVRQVALSSSTVLLQSESGTGKEILAHSLHELSSRASGPFVKLNCASVPGSLLESEMFGYEPGAFTGAKKGGNPGRFEQAHGGTIFLDEIGEMPLSLQAMLLRVIQEKEIQRLGGIGSKQLDVRIVCATNKDLFTLVTAGSFRSDLFYRLNVVSINIPPLKKRKEDIKPLVLHFLRQYSMQFKKRILGISKEVYYIFMHYDWPGNVRELGNVIEFAFNIIDREIIEVRHLPYHIIEKQRNFVKKSDKFNDMMDEYRYTIVHNTLLQYNGNKQEAAKALGLSRSNFYRILQAGPAKVLEE